MSPRRPPVLAGLGAAGGRLADIVDQLPAAVAVCRGPDLVVELANPRFQLLAPGAEMAGRPLAELFPQRENVPLLDLLRDVIATGETAQGAQRRAVVDGAEAFFDFVFVPLRGPEGTVDGVIVHAVDVTDLVRALRSAEVAERRYRVLADANVVGVVIADEHRIIEANDAFLAITGRDRAALERGEVDWRAMTPPEWRHADEQAMAGLASAGSAPAFEKEYARPDGRRVPVLISAVALEERPLRIMAIVIDRSAERAAERERERLLAREREARRDAEDAAGRATRLQRVTSALSAATSAEEIGRVTLEQAMQALSAPAGTLAFPQGGHFTLAHARGYAPHAEAEWQRFPIDAPAPLAEVIRTGRPVILERREDWAPYPQLARTIERYEAFAGVPFAFGGVVLGGMALSFTGPRLVTPAERGLLVALGRLAAQALERTRLFEQRGYVARTLQQGLLPDRLADAPGLEVAVRYHSIADGGEVGGDFYDFFDVAPGRWVAATGDVAGKGTAAAVLTGLARHTLRAIALREDSPATMLRFLDEAIRRQSSPSAFCTVGCAAMEPGPDGFRAVLASGGHPHPVLVRAGGRAEEVEVRGTLLGVQPDPPLEEVAIELLPGDVLISYTDGVTDARDARGARFGEERLLAAVDAAVAAGARDAEDMAEALDAAVGVFEDERRRDDRAILVIRVCP